VSLGKANGKVPYCIVWSLLCYLLT